MPKLLPLSCLMYLTAVPSIAQYRWKKLQFTLLPYWRNPDNDAYVHFDVEGSPSNLHGMVRAPSALVVLCDTFANLAFIPKL